MTADPEARRAFGRGVAGAVLWPVLGCAVVMAVWWLAGWRIAANPDTANFAGFAPGPTLRRLADLVARGELWRSVGPSLGRVGQGMAVAAALGVPLGVLIGGSKALRAATHIPFQFLRMVSPLAWMPIAVLSFASWDGAIVFLIAVAAVWPVTFATANGLAKIDPNWFKVARNLGAGPVQTLRVVILPAIARDVLTGIRLALGVAWIVLVPAEYLGVTSGLGYAINDARDTLEYDRLAAMVLVIGALGFALDGLCLGAIRRFGWDHER
ncbi:ABC transporter permease [Azospirillum doebereinerae]|uniref:ABC transporter permease n=1 Tax=Azospirillum doebereinerae TaxID=92933 RepID=UPI001EE56F82|nr:ABC transporter permease [Azospirillum doebereinerae]